MKNFLNKLLIPFAIIHIRIIQYQYKKITTENYYNRSNQNLTRLRLLQAKEHYYKESFSSWGKFHPKFSYAEGEYRRHLIFMNWLFPEKDFKEWDIIIWHNPEAVTYYHNKIWNLQNGKSPMYEIEIPEQLKEWKMNEEKYYDS